MITKLTYKDAWGNPQSAVVGVFNVKEIIEHSAQGEGDKFYYDIISNDGDKRRVFTPIDVIFTTD